MTIQAASEHSDNEPQPPRALLRPEELSSLMRGRVPGMASHALARFEEAAVGAAAPGQKPAGVVLAAWGSKWLQILRSPQLGDQ